MNSYFYQVVQDWRTRSQVCACENCVWWTVAYQDASGEPVEIGKSWQGTKGNRKARDLCDSMNEAHDRALSVNEDGRKWRALRNSARITAVGMAGLGQEQPPPGLYAHLTLNLWTVHDVPSDELAVEWLEKYVAVAERAQAEKAKKDELLGDDIPF